MRLKIIRIIVVLSFVFIFSTLFYIQLIKGEHYYSLSKNNRIRVVPLESWRGRILDRLDRVLADNRPSYSVTVTPQDIEDKDKLFDFLSKTLNKDKNRLLRLFQARQYAPFAPVVIAQNITQSQAIVIEENRYQFPSLFVQQGFQRVYPLKENSAHVLGYIGRINPEELEELAEYGYQPEFMIGKSGVERFYDQDLKGTPGGIQIEVNSRGQQVRLLGLKEALKGKDLKLTIDSNLQRIGDELLGKKPGAIVVIDVTNGEILSMTSSPSFDPNIFVDNELGHMISDVLRNEDAPILNRAIKGAYPPGSVFKVPVAMAGLDSKKIDPQTRFECLGYYELGGKKFGCTHQHGWEDLVDGIAHSCNVYFYHVGLLAGADLIYHYATLLGLGRLTHIDLPYEKSGFVPNRRQIKPGHRWFAGDTLNLSIGQGDTLATPLQLAQMMAIIARDGVQVPPHIVKAIGEAGVHKTFTRRVNISSEILNEIKKGLRATVTDPEGTAYLLNFERILVAGKTGTAQTGRDQEDHAWFAGYLQGQNQQLALCVFLEHGGSSYNAVALTRELLLRMHEEDILN